MTEITVVKVSINGEELTNGIFVTPAGATALLQPLQRKELVANESRAEDGKEYLKEAMHFDDTPVSVQFALIGDDAASKMSNLASQFASASATDGSIGITASGYGGGNFIYKGTSSISSQSGGKVILANFNLIKLSRI